MDSETSEVEWVAGKWLGSSNNSCVTIIDTPGIGDSVRSNCELGEALGETVRQLSHIHAFVLVYPGNKRRFDKSTEEQLSFYEEFFGVESFWRRTIIEVSFWRSGTRDKIDRNQSSLDEGRLTQRLNWQLKKKFHLTQSIPVVFVDSMYTQKRGEDDPEEKKTFKKETETLWKFIQSGTPYTCEDHCKGQEFLNGRPILTSAPVTSARLNDKVIMRFDVWFSNCDGTGADARSYSILKDGVLVWKVIDEQGQKGKEFKPITSNSFSAPLDMKVIDKCSQIEGRLEKCKVSLSKYKKVKVVLSKVHEESYGNYSIKNTAGWSESVHIKKMVDGFYSQWSDWSTWNEVNLKQRVAFCAYYRLQSKLS